MQDELKKFGVSEEWERLSPSINPSVRGIFFGLLRKAYQAGVHAGSDPDLVTAVTEMKSLAEVGDTRAKELEMILNQDGTKTVTPIDRTLRDVRQAMEGLYDSLSDCLKGLGGNN